MTNHDVEQGTPAWMLLRLGNPTASQFDRILTTKQRKYAAGAEKYKAELLAEWVLGYPLDFGASSPWMDRGTEMEGEAKSWYEFQNDVTVDKVGFVTREDGRVGGSPDGLVGDDGGVEFKCPAIHTHVGYLLNPDSLVDNYFAQVQGYLYLTGRAWMDLVAYNPELPAVVVRMEPDAEYLAALVDALDRFLAELDAGKAILAPHRKTSILQFQGA